MIKVIPNNSTSPENNICRLNCISQKIKNKAFKTKKSGSIKVKTDRNGKKVGAKKGKIYARKVSTATTILSK